MHELVVRPSMRPARTAYTLVFTVIAVCVLLYNNSGALQRQTPWILVLPALLLALPMAEHVRRSRTELTIAEGKLRYKAGVLKKVERTIRVAAIGNVTVEQTLGQRMLGIGKLMIETEDGVGLAVGNIDNPQRVAEAILDIAGKYAKKERDR